jgi:hypothetical protein
MSSSRNATNEVHGRAQQCSYALEAQMLATPNQQI